jgi:hypothetical protein
LGISSLSRKQNTPEKIVQQKTRTIKGVISSQDGPIPLATVYIKGTKKFSQADFKGNYKIQVAKGDIIIFSSLGYNDIEIIVKEQEVINTKLEDVPLIITGRLRIVDTNNTPE